MRVEGEQILSVITVEVFECSIGMEDKKRKDEREKEEGSKGKERAVKV